MTASDHMLEPFKIFLHRRGHPYMHDRSRVHRDDGFRGGRAIAQGTMWSFGIVVFPPLFDQDFRFPKAVEDFSVEQFIAEPGIEAFAVAVLPR